jgi:hypothetical protein
MTDTELEEIQQNPHRYRLPLYLRRLPWIDIAWLATIEFPGAPRLDEWLKEEAEAELDRQRHAWEGGEVEEPPMLAIDFRDWSGAEVGSALLSTDVVGRGTNDVEMGALIDALHTILCREAKSRLRAAERVDDDEIW